MALEQWEIDLRKQLDSKKAKKQEKWENKLAEEVKEIKPRKENTTLFVVVLVFLGLSTLFLYDYKSGGSLSGWIKSKFQPAKVVESCPPPPQNDDFKSLRDEIKRVESQQKDEIGKINGKLKWHNDRITLLGMTVNENFLIMYNNASRSNLVFLNRDWTIDKMPQYLELSESDKEYLRQFVKPQ